MCSNVPCTDMCVPVIIIILVYIRKIHKNKPFDEVKTVRCKIMVKIFVSVEVRKHLYIVILYHMLIKYVCAVSIECHVQ